MLGGLTSVWGSFLGGIAIGICEALVLWNYPVGGVLELLLAGVILLSMLLKPGLGRTRQMRSGADWTLTSAVRPLTPAEARLPLVRIGARCGADRRDRRGGSRPARRQTLVAGDPDLDRPDCHDRPVAGRAHRLRRTRVARPVRLRRRRSSRRWAPVPARLPAPRHRRHRGRGRCRRGGRRRAARAALRGLFLAVSTLGFALAVSSWLFSQDWLVHNSPETGTSLQLSRPRLLGIDFDQEDRYYWLCLGVLLVVTLMVYRLRRTGPGRAMIAVRDNEASAASLSLAPWKVKLTAFALSGAIASLAGFLYGGMLINFASDPSNTFAPSESLSFVVIAVFGGITSATGAVLGALWVEGHPAPARRGLRAALLGARGDPDPAGHAGRSGDARVRAPRPVRLVRRRSPAGGSRGRPADGRFAPSVTWAGSRHECGLGQHSSRRERRPSAAPLVASSVTVRFGGLRALDGVTVEAAAGEVLGLMGPNGAGKTTLFDVLSGNVRPARGRVELDGRDITRHADVPAGPARARAHLPASPIVRRPDGDRVGHRRPRTPPADRGCSLRWSAGRARSGRSGR